MKLIILSVVSMALVASAIEDQAVLTKSSQETAPKTHVETIETLLQSPKVADKITTKDSDKPHSCNCHSLTDKVEQNEEPKAIDKLKPIRVDPSAETIAKVPDVDGGESTATSGDDNEESSLKKKSAKLTKKEKSKLVLDKTELDEVKDVEIDAQVRKPKSKLIKDQAKNTKDEKKRSKREAKKSKSNSSKKGKSSSKSGKKSKRNSQ